VSQQHLAFSDSLYPEFQNEVNTLALAGSKPLNLFLTPSLDERLEEEVRGRIFFFFFN
jgi:hypothetical protein